MRYSNIREGFFISRPNRFIAHVEIDGQIEVAHVKNTGRCKELLTDRAKVYLQEFDTKTRKTKYDLISVYKNDILINMDSQAPNNVVGEYLEKGYLIPEITYIKREQKYGDSRFDYYIEAGERRIFAEVKGVTLEEDGQVRFPDAPTERGIKHIYHLIEAMKEGYEAYIIFVIQLKGAKYFSPNDMTQPQFGKALREAQKAGVNIIALDCIVTKDTLEIDLPVAIRL